MVSGAAENGALRHATARQAYLQVCRALAAQGIADADFDAAQLLLLAGAPDYRLLPDAVLPDAVSDRVAALMARRCAHEPLQYIAGQWDFFDMTLAVGEGVLIPRADTEVVAEAAIEAARQAPTLCPQVVDLCSGTGAIALAVARHVPGAQVTAVELSPQALVYLNQNNAAYGHCVTVVQGDVFAWQSTLAPCSVDVVVSNPPYIADDEMAALAPELAFEPRMALEADDNGLAFYKHIAPAYYPALKPGGWLVLEIGAAQGDAVCALCRAAGYHSVSVCADWGGNPRVVRARK
jgi:release factor glutamine methyltransferase